jgi:hypothetical protein
MPGFGLSVEPLEDVLAGEAIFEAEAELIAEGFGKAGDFAGGGHLKLRGKTVNAKAPRVKGARG